MSQGEFGGLVGIDQFHVSKLMCGTRKAGRTLAQAIQKATKGYVDISDWDEPAAEKRAS